MHLECLARIWTLNRIKTIHLHILVTDTRIELLRLKIILILKNVTRQFKRGLYEIFLQKYHFLTKDGNNPKFDFIRNYARYDIGNPHVYYAFNNIILAPGIKERKNPILHISDKLIDDMEKYGFFHIWLLGHNFYIEVFPILTNRYRNQYLQMQANSTLLNAYGNESIYEFSDIKQIDFFMQRFNS